MSLRFKEKQSLYHHLGQLLRSGVTFPAALQSLGRNANGNLKRLLSSLNRSVSAGRSVGEAFEAEQPTVSALEASIVTAVERGGRLDHGMTQLSEYFATLEAARARVWKQVAYPLFLLHFGILIMGAKTLVVDGLTAYLQEVGSLLGIVYALALVVYLAVIFLAKAGAKVGAIDGLLRAIPMIGNVRRHFAASRFCTTYELQLEAGINLMDALTAAGRASQSALMGDAISRVLPDIRTGAQAGPLLAMSGAFPEETMQGISVGEQTGRLDEELRRLAIEHRQRAVSLLEILSEWLPRLLYLAVVAYLGYRIVSWYAGYLRQVQEITDQIR